MSVTPFTPDPDQESEIQKALADDSGGYLAAHVTGRGKTGIAVEIALRMWASRVLIIAPPGTFGLVDEDAHIYDGWAGTAFRQSSGAVTLRKCSNSRKAEKENLQALLNGDEGWFFISRELFQGLDHELQDQFDRQGNPVYVTTNGTVKLGKDGQPVQKRKRVQKGLWRKMHFDVAVYDEIQQASSHNSNGFNSWKTVKATKKVAMSADWFGNTVTNMWAPAFALWPEHVPASYGRWSEQFLESEYDHFAWNKKKYVAEKVPGEFVSTLPCYGRLESTLGKPPVPEVRWVDLLPKQRKAYNELEESMVTFIEENPLVVEFPMTLKTRLRQATLGEFMFDDEGELDFKVGGQSAKLDEAKSIIDDHPGEQFVLFTDSARFARAAASQIKGAAAYTGALSHKGRQELKGRFISGEVQHLICTMQSAGVGLDKLQDASRNVIILSIVEGQPLMTEQSIGRVWRQGQTEEVNVWNVLARDSRDLGVENDRIKKALQNNQAKMGVTA